MIYTYSKVVNIPKLATEIETGLNLKLIATEETDSVNGYLQSNQESLEVMIYDIIEEPNKEHKTTLMATILTEEQKNQLASIVANHVN